jgi:hypothetical protein
VLEHLAEIATIDPAIAGRAPNEVLGFVLRRIAEALPDGRGGSSRPILVHFVPIRAGAVGGNTKVPSSKNIKVPRSAIRPTHG